MKRAAIYARVSTDLQRENYSVPTQIEACLKNANSRQYAVVGDQFVDLETGFDSRLGNGAIPAYVDDISSSDLNRPALDAAINYLQNTGFDVLIVYALDRLARDPYIRETIERLIIENGAKVEYVTGNFDDTPEGAVRKDLEATFAKWENAKRVERCNRGKRKKAETGFFVGGRAIYGYEQNDYAHAGLAVREDQARVIRRIFDLFVNHGESIRGIAQTLTDEGAKNWSGKTRWGKSTVARILKNPAYIGRLYYNRRKRKGNVREMRDPDDWVEIVIVPIVEEWIFEEAQRRLEKNKKRVRRQPKRFYLLTGMVFCERCESPYFAQTQKAGSQRRINDGQSYRHRAKEGHCTNHWISARKLEPIVWEKIKQVLMDPESLLKGYEAALGRQQAAEERQKALLQSLINNSQKLEQQRLNLNRAYIDPDIRLSKNEYIQQKTAIDGEIGEIEKEIEMLEVELARIPTPAEMNTLETFAAKVRAKLLNGNPSAKEKRRILELLHIKAWICGDGIVRIDGWFGDSLLSRTY